MRRAIIAAVLLMTASQVAIADHLTLKNGDRLTGKIAKSDPKGLMVKTDLVGDLIVPWDAIDQLSSDDPVFFVLKDGRVISGTLSGSPGKIEVATRDQGTVSIDRSTVAAVRSAAEQQAYLAQLDRIKRNRLLDFWSGVVDVGYSLSQGNTTNNNLAFGLGATRVTPRDQIATYAAAIYSTNTVSGVHQTTANVVRGGIRYDYNLMPRVFVFGNTDFEHNGIQDLNLRWILGGGVGYHVIKSERTVFDVFGGADLNKEYFRNDLDRTSAEIQAGESASMKLSDRVLWKERLIFFPNLSDGGEYRLAFDTSIVGALTKRLSWQATLSERYLSNPPPLTKKNDLLLTTGLRFTFGQAK